MGLLKLRSLIHPKAKFSILQKYLSDSLNHLDIWQVSQQLSHDDTCQISTWCSISMCVLEMLKNSENNGAGQIGSATPYLRWWWEPRPEYAWYFTGQLQVLESSYKNIEMKISSWRNLLHLLHQKLSKMTVPNQWQKFGQCDEISMKVSMKNKAMWCKQSVSWGWRLHASDYFSYPSPWIMLDLDCIETLSFLFTTEVYGGILTIYSD